ncbi:hypothetical protein ACWGBH_36170 [Streptomyces massasporeus]
MPDAPVPAATEAVPPVVIVVVPVGAVPAGSTVVLALTAEVSTGRAAPTTLPPLPPYPPSVPERRFTRTLREWNLAWWFAVAAAALEVPLTHVLTYYLHQHGLISPLEYWFPLG